MLQQFVNDLNVTLYQVGKLSLWLSVLVVIFVPLERLFAAHSEKVFRKGISVDLIYYFLSSLLPTILLSFPIAFLAWLVRNTIPEDFLQFTASQPVWIKMVAGLVAGEVGYYWGHRWSHEIPFLWKFHSIHHSAEHVDFLVNSRAHPIDHVFGRFCGIVPIYLLGLGGPVNIQGSTIPIIVTLVGIVWGFFIHANVRWRFGPLEWLVSTPAFHHWHHTRSGPINKNYSSTLPILDWVFGTFYLPAKELPTSYGIKAKMPDSIIDQLLLPFTPTPKKSTKPVPEIVPTPVQEAQLVKTVAEPANNTSDFCHTVNTSSLMINTNAIHPGEMTR